MPETNYLKLSEQLCFPLYATSRMITRLYQPLLESIGLTYPQYLAMLVLWEEDKLTIGKMGKRLYLNTNTLTPMLKKMQTKGLIEKQRSIDDERTVHIQLTAMGKEMKTKASCIPMNLLDNISMSAEDLVLMREMMWKLLNSFEADPVEKA